MPVFSSIQANNTSIGWPNARNCCRQLLILWLLRIALPFVFYLCQDDQILGLSNVFGVGPLISFIAMQFIVVQLWSNLIKYLTIMVAGASGMNRSTKLALDSGLPVLAASVLNNRPCKIPETLMNTSVQIRNQPSKLSRIYNIAKLK